MVEPAFTCRRVSKNAFCQMCVPIYACFESNEGGVVDLRRLNSTRNRREVGRADGGNEF